MSFSNEADKIQVLYVTASGDIIGGGQVSLLNLLKNLDRSKFSPLVICPEDGLFVDKLRQINIVIKIIRIKSLRYFHLVSFVKAIIKIYKVIKKNRISLLHCNAGSSRETICSALSAKLCGIPFIWHARVTVQQQSWLLDRLYAALSTRIIAISDAVRQRFNWLPDNKIDVIYNGVDLNRFNTQNSAEAVRKEYNISDSTLVVGTVGRLDRWKGHRYFIRSAAEVLKDIPEVVFFVVGPDGDTGKDELGELAEQLRIRDKVIFTGYREDMPLIISTFDVFVLASENEPFGRVLIEAMACAKPIVAFRSGAVPEIVKEGITGFLVAPYDSKAIAGKIVYLLKNKDIAGKFGRNGRVCAERLFDIKDHVKKIENLYMGLLKNRVYAKKS